MSKVTINLESDLEDIHFLISDQNCLWSLRYIECTRFRVVMIMFDMFYQIMIISSRKVHKFI